MKDAFDRRDELLGGLLVHLRMPAPPPTLEARLRMTFRRYRARRVARARAVAGLAAAVVLAAAGALYVARVSTQPVADGASKPVVTPVSLDGFEPINRPKLGRLKDAGRP